MNVRCRLVLEREVARVCDDFRGFGALVREISNRLTLLSHCYSTQSALVTELSSLKNVALHDSPTSSSDTEAFARLNKCYSSVCFDVFSFKQGSKNPGFYKKAQPSGFLGVLLGFGVLFLFLDKQEK